MNKIEYFIAPQLTSAPFDIHKAHAARDLEKLAEDVTQEERRRAKFANMFDLYGVSTSAPRWVIRKHHVDGEVVAGGFRDAKAAKAWLELVVKTPYAVTVETIK